MADRDEDKLFNVDKPPKSRINLDNPFIHIDYTPEKQEEMKKDAEKAYLFVFPPKKE